MINLRMEFLEDIEISLKPYEMVELSYIRLIRFGVSVAMQPMCMR